MSHPPLTSLTPKYPAGAVQTEIGWAHPKTGEQVVSMRGLPNPVADYKPNSKNNSFVTTPLVKPANTVVPAITGTAKVGVALTVSDGTWTGSTPRTYQYQWIVNGTPGAWGSAKTFTPVVGQIGATIGCNVRAANSAGNTVATAVAVGPVVA